MCVLPEYRDLSTSQQRRSAVIFVVSLVRGVNAAFGLLFGCYAVRQ